MENSKNQQVQKFLNEFMELDIKKYKMLQKMRKIVFTQHPKVAEKIMYGGIMFSIKSDIGGLFVSQNHISFEFVNGYRFEDPKKLLEGVGKYRRHLKIKSMSDIENKMLKFFIGQAC